MMSIEKVVKLKPRLAHLKNGRIETLKKVDLHIFETELLAYRASNDEYRKGGET